MGGISIWHWLIIILPIPLAFIVKQPSGPNRFGPAPDRVSFTSAVDLGFSKSFDFSARASRSEYWFFWLFQFLLFFVAEVALIFLPDFRVFVFLLNIGLLVPMLALTVRRLHDGNRSGWWQLLYLTGVGGITLFIWMLQRPKDDLATQEQPIQL
jgi:uncharacterized membrane protein YhaH (DUF805 family)